MSLFAVAGENPDEGLEADLAPDARRMEEVITSLADEAGGIDEDDPRQAARLMRKFSGMTGMEFGDGMQEALGRMEAGEDPEQIEAEMSEQIDSEEPLLAPGRAGRAVSRRQRPPARDDRLYDL